MPEIDNRLTIDRICTAQQQTGLPFCQNQTYQRHNGGRILFACGWGQVFLAEGYGLTPDNNPDAYDSNGPGHNDHVPLPRSGYLGGFIDGFDAAPEDSFEGDPWMEEEYALYHIGYQDGVAARKEFLGA